MAPSIILFDIDGTLVDTGGAGRRAVRRAFAELHGRPDACDAMAFGGRTDGWIFAEAARFIGVALDAAAHASLVAAYLRALEQEVARSPHYVVHAGAVAAVDHAESRGHAVGLGTGNLRAGAVVKLRRGGLDVRFAFGGFGCDAHERADVLRAGALRGAERLGLPLEACRVVVLGDTPHDVTAARAIGAVSVAVTTGPFDATALRAVGADVVVDRLDAPEALDAIDG
jgi:phosphoglycolate phosphatase-like HAD superfamily hydrolase